MTHTEGLISKAKLSEWLKEEINHGYSIGNEYSALKALLEEVESGTFDLPTVTDEQVKEIEEWANSGDAVTMPMSEIWLKDSVLSLISKYTETLAQVEQLQDEVKFQVQRNDEHRAKNDELAARVERLNAKVFVLERDNDMLESTYSAQEENLNQAVKALEASTEPLDFLAYECTDINESRKTARNTLKRVKNDLQSIKGDNTHVETTS